jgi:hypothetical protein
MAPATEAVGPIEFPTILRAPLPRAFGSSFGAPACPMNLHTASSAPYQPPLAALA